MYTRNSVDGYYRFRTFMMGTKDTAMFPRGVIYEGVSSEYQKYRGASAAMDMTLPILDEFLQI